MRCDGQSSIDIDDPGGWVVAQRFALIRHVRLSVALCALFVGAANAADRRYVELSTPQLTLVSAAGEAETRQIAQRIAMFRSAVELALGVPPATTIHTRIYALSSQDWKKYAQPRPGVSGYFISHPASSDLMFNVDDDQAHAFELIFHEYAHHILRTSWVGEIPPFLDEGLAEVFSTAQFSGGTVRLAPRNDHIRLLRRRNWLPLDRLLGIRRHDPEYVDHNLASAFYAQAWATMYYIMAVNRTAGVAAIGYLRALREGPSNIDTSQLFSNGTGQDINGAIAAFIQRRERLPIAQLEIAGDVAQHSSSTVRRLDHQERTLALGELMLRFGNRHQMAQELFEEVLRREPDNVRAGVGAAWSHLQARNWQQAETLLDRTTAASDVDPATAVALGRGLYQLVTRTTRDTPDAEQRERLERARAYFDSAMATKRARIEAISGYVLSSLALGRSEPELIVLAEIGYRSAPRSSDLAVALAILHDLGGRKDTARTYWHAAARNTQTGPLRTRILNELQRSEEDQRQSVP